MAKELSRPRKSAHLFLRRERYDKSGKLTHNAVWIIKDGEVKVGTGCGREDLAGAEKQLNDYLTKKHAHELLKGAPQKLQAHEVPVADVIHHYITDISPRFESKPKQKRDFIKRMEALIRFWGEKFVSDINKRSCEEFATKHAQSTARRMLEDLRAAVELSMGDDLIADTRVNFKLPPPRKARYRFYTREQAAKIVWAAYREKGTYSYTGKRAKAENRGQTIFTKARPKRHIARFFLTACYTGTRTDRIEQASFIKEDGRPWIDLERGIFYRAWDGELVPDNKRAEPIRIPQRLLAHMRRWHRNGAKYLVEFNGKPVSTASAFFRMLKEVLPDDLERKGLNRHSTRHTAATWLMQGGGNTSDIAGYLSIDEKTLKKHYGHHHPDHQVAIDESFTSGRAGRIQSRNPHKVHVPTATVEAASSGDLTAEKRKGILDLIDIADGPLELIPLIEAAADEELGMLREKVKRAARSGKWEALL